MAGTGQRTVSLVLGGGGARGYAHIGVIRAIEERALSIRSVVGTSIGALVGAVYCTGKLGEFERLVRTIRRRQILALLDVQLGGGGLVRGDRVMAMLRDLCGDAPIEELPIRFTAVASDLLREREVWIDRGPLFDAVRASISLPLFFAPVDRAGTRLVDGGLFDNVPVAPTYRDGTDLTIAVNLSGPDPASAEPAPEAADRGARGRFWRRAPDADGGVDDRAWGPYFVATQCLEVMQGIIARHRLAAHAPEVLIEIPRHACRMLEFDRAEELIPLGYEAAKRRLAELDVR